MVEPAMLARTGFTMAEHQKRTVDNYLELQALAPDLPFVPVLQGWSVPDYLRATELFEDAGVDLGALPLVGVGSVCRRSCIGDIAVIMTALAERGLRLHGFGIKTRGLTAVGNLIDSADSLAWSLRGRHLPGCAPSHASESNCLRFALQWRRRLLNRLPTASTGAEPGRSA